MHYMLTERLLLYLFHIAIRFGLAKVLCGNIYL